MELIEIIKSSLSLFALLAFIVVMISYAIYKMRDSKRLKPYERVGLQTVEAASPAVIQNQAIQETPAYAPAAYSEPAVYYVNQPHYYEAVNQPVMYNNPAPEQYVMVHSSEPSLMPQQVNRFKVINSETDRIEQLNNTYERREIRPVKPVVLNDMALLTRAGGNMYSFYSEKDANMMHKLKFSPVR